MSLEETMLYHELPFLLIFILIDLKKNPLLFIPILNLFVAFFGYLHVAPTKYVISICPVCLLKQLQ